MGHRASRADSGPVIAFAGGGASATLATVALLRATTWLGLRYHVVLYDEHGRHARGSGYPLGEDSQLANAPVKSMSALPDRPCHLLEWAHGRGIWCVPDTRPTLADYGDYLAETLDSTASWALPHATLGHQQARVSHVFPGDNGAEVHLATGQRRAVSAVIVATGDPVAHPPPRVSGTVAGETPGLATCSRGALLITRSRVASGSVFALGPARRGHRADGIPQVRDQAEELAQRIADTVLRDRQPVGKRAASDVPARRRIGGGTSHEW